MQEDALNNINQVFTTIRSTPIAADHSVYFKQLDELCAVFGENTDELKKFWKRLARVQGKNPALIQIAWKNYIVQLNFLEIKLETHVRALQSALEKAKEDGENQKEEN